MTTDPNPGPQTADPGGMAPRSFDLVVVAASAGGVNALLTLFAGLPASFSVPVAVVLHRSVQTPSMLSEVLDRRTPLAVRDALPGEAPQPGNVYIAPPGRHLLVSPERTFAFGEEARIKHLLSAADPLFISAAEVYHERVIAIVLTGGDGDGAEGARAVGLAGGIVIAQNEATSLVFSMPRATIATGHADTVLAIEDIGPALLRITETGRLD
jgi:two-component system, chemotaxis family, protein-glutamate methylesterase/glutaminase